MKSIGQSIKFEKQETNIKGQAFHETKEIANPSNRPGNLYRSIDIHFCPDLWKAAKLVRSTTALSSEIYPDLRDSLPVFCFIPSLADPVAKEQ